VGSKADIDLLAQALEENEIMITDSGPRYHKVPASDDSWRLPAHEVPEHVIMRLKARLFELAKRHSVSRLALTHDGALNGTMHLDTDPIDHFETFLRMGKCPKTKGIFFVRKEDILDGCSKCIRNSHDLARSVLTVENPRMAIPLLYYALEELGKAAVLFNSTAQSERTKSGVIVVKGFYDHRCKLAEASYELLGIDVRVDDYGHERRGGAIEKLTLETNLAVMWDKQQLDKLWALKDSEVVEMFHVLVDYDTLFRDYSLYVDYNSDQRKWNEPSTRWNQSTCERAAKVLVMVTKRLIEEVGKLSCFPKVQRLNDLIAPFSASLSSSGG
jgi:hypothetical protein